MRALVWHGRSAAVNPLVPGDETRPGIEQLSRRCELIGVHRPGGFATAVRVPAGQLRELSRGAGTIGLMTLQAVAPGGAEWVVALVVWAALVGLFALLGLI